MKKTLIAVAALAATGAFAQVSVYGRLDAGYAVTTSTTGGVDTKANGVQSHNSVSSMWGIKGSEDLGGGMKANFTLEQDVYPADGNTGVSGAAGGTGNQPGFNRTSLVGLSGGFGSLSFGRDYVPTFKLIAATDVNSLSRISTVQLAANTGLSTAPNLVFYSTPVMSGFQVNVAYGNQDQSTTTDTYQKTTNLSATYANGPLMVGVGTGSNEQKNAGAASTSAASAVSGYQITGILAQEKISSNVIAASYDFGRFALKGNYITAKGSLGAVDTELTELNVGATVPMGKVTLIAQVGSNKATQTGATTDLTGNDFVIGADYSLSARTALFAKTGTMGKVSGGTVDNKVVSTAVGIKTVF